jgi:hypothetical protein
VGLERETLSLGSTIEELLGRKNSGSGLESRKYGHRDPSRWPLRTLYPQNLALTSSACDGRSVGVVHSRTQATEFSFLVLDAVGRDSNRISSECDSRSLSRFVYCLRNWCRAVRCQMEWYRRQETSLLYLLRRLLEKWTRFWLPTALVTIILNANCSATSSTSLDTKLLMQSFRPCRLYKVFGVDCVTPDWSQGSGTCATGCLASQLYLRRVPHTYPSIGHVPFSFRLIYLF